jgi:hypothetical protein
VRFGNDNYYTHRGLFYRPGPGGYVVVRPPAGIIVPSLPIGFARIYFNNVLYFRFNDIYYRPTTGGYIVVQTPTVVVTPPPVTVVTTQPAVVATTTPAPVVAEPVAAGDSDYQSFYVDGIQYHFKNGQFFKKSADGLIWVEPPMGAIIQKLPADATSVWYQDIEYFDCDSVYFRKTPDGYKVVDAPWTQQE